ncbi:squalene--hopene cyclase [Planctopirus hydrillae]|uniref:Squalene--hopene cyclase n=1 Tax=Planctopirus hydrillae TaxID=1841610 RepID=A0A1C3ED65_9PLAN|nr:squalene--hopene cyclase [Planctopirus hydrillae]ODA31186.1 squalene--hopene cyclase [Planctopirus hydrillae]
MNLARCWTLLLFRNRTPHNHESSWRVCWGMVGLLLLADRGLDVAGQRLAMAQDGANQVSSSKPIPGWEVTPDSEAALQKGLAWLARNQGTEGNWESEDLGLVGLGGLSFLAAGHLPQRGRYGDTVDRAFKYVLKKAKPSGLLNSADAQRDMYNHGLAAFVLGQAYGMTGDPQIGRVLDKSLRLISNTQCEDGGWDYRAKRQQHGHDLSLVVMQAKALRSAVDSGFEVRNDVVRLAIQSVRDHYKAENGARGFDEKAQEGPGQFTYDGNRTTLAMAACGVVCLQEFGQYDDWRIAKNMEQISKEVSRIRPNRGSGEVPFDAYTLYYVGQAIYQTGGADWQKNYPALRDYLVASQVKRPENPGEDGSWRDTRWVHGKQGQLYGTAVACFILAMPNRYLPILQEGKIEGLKDQLSGPPAANKPR